MYKYDKNKHMSPYTPTISRYNICFLHESYTFSDKMFNSVLKL